MSADRNLLFAVLALQADCVNREQFIEACTLWAGNKNTPIDALMIKKAWLTPEDRADVERLVERKLKKQGGNVRKSLAEAVGEDVRQSLAAVPDSDLRQSLAAGLPPKFVGLATLPPPPSSASSRYSLSRVHATGGIGRVWLAHDTAMGRSVALKELRPERVGEHATIERFVKEARITGQLEHPGIVPIYELAHRPQDNEPFYTMRFIRGRTLAAAIHRFHDPKLPPPSSPAMAFRELLAAFLGACNAAAYAHSRGVIHRDLKPANIVLGDYGEVIVLDWGMAKVLPAESASVSPEPAGQIAGVSTGPEPPPRIEFAGTDSQASAGMRLGTPAYMSPEQAEGRHDLHDQRSDVYALGAILYEILTGFIPFDAANTDELLDKVCQEPPLLPRVRKKGVPRPLEAVCLKALAKRREDRYPSALALAQDVQHWLADEPVTSYSEAWRERLARWLRRHRTFGVSFATGLMVTALVMAVSLVFVFRAKNREATARREAETNEQEAKAQRSEALLSSYIANVRLAQRSWEDGQLTLAMGLLEEANRRNSEGEDLRGFDWYFLEKRCHGTIRTLAEYGGRVESVALSPDGRWLVSGDSSGHVELRDLPAGRVSQVFKGKALGPNALAFDSESRYLAWPMAGGRVRLLDLTTGKQAYEFEGPERGVSGIAFSADGCHLAVSGLSEKGRSGRLRNGPEVRVFDLKGRSLVRSLLGLKLSVWNVAFSPDGKSVAAGDAEGTVKLWELATGTARTISMEGQSHIRSVAFSPDGNQVAVASLIGPLKLWNIKGGKVRSLPQEGNVRSVAFGPDGLHFATGDMDGALKIWAVATGELTRDLRGHTGAIYSVAFSSDGQQIATGGVDKTVKLWNVFSSRTPRTINAAVGSFGVCAFSPDRSRAAWISTSGARAQTVYLWDLDASRRLLSSEALNNVPLPGGITGASLSSDGTLLAVTSFNLACVFELATGTKRLQVSLPLAAAAFSPNGHTLAATGLEGPDQNVLYVWKMLDGDKPAKTVLNLPLGAQAISFGPDGQLVALAGSAANSIKVWDIASDSEVLVMRAAAIRASPVFSPNGKRLAFGSDDRAVVVDLGSGKILFELKGHRGPVTAIAFNPNGQRLATVGADGTARIWEAVAGREVLSLKSATKSLTNAAFSRDGFRLFTVGADGSIDSWDATPSGE